MGAPARATEGARRVRRVARARADRAWPPRWWDTRRPKVFVVGWHRTGTTSMHVALDRLGYTVRDFDTPLMAALFRDGDVEAVLSAARKADAFRDFPWSLLFREFDERYPRAKFILTVRDVESWMESYTRLHQRQSQRTADWLYGPGPGPAEDPARFIERYEQHNSEVLAYFEGRPNCLVFDAFGGDGWSELCGFLDRPVRDDEFPDEKSISFR